MTQLHQLAPQIAEKISEYQRIIGFRHALVHGYDSLNHELVWYVIEYKLCNLQGEVPALLDPATEQP